MTLGWKRFVHPICIFPSWEGKAKNPSLRPIVRDTPGRIVELDSEQDEYLFTLVLTDEGYTVVSM